MMYFLSHTLQANHIRNSQNAICNERELQNLHPNNFYENQSIFKIHSNFKLTLLYNFCTEVSLHYGLFVGWQKSGTEEIKMDRIYLSFKYIFS